MKRYECPSCHTRYHVEPAECPACMWVNNGETFMIDHGPKADLIITESASVAKAVAIDSGFAGYNQCPHFLIDIPDGFATISARLSDGRRVTFAFVPYAENAPAQCVDIIYHDAHEFVINGKRKVPMQNIVLFDRGDKPDVAPIVTCTTLLLYDREPVK
jgi:hypothetical protein